MEGGGRRTSDGWRGAQGRSAGPSSACLHVLAGRYLSRREARDCQCVIELVHVMELRIGLTAADPEHVVDRSGEPRTTSDFGDVYVDHADMIEGWLEWEGKRRLALWPRS